MNIRKITYTAVLLAICIASQYFKNLGPMGQFITGPIINAVLIIATLYTGLSSAIILSILTPITSLIITQSPLYSAVPALMPAIMIGNIIIVLSVYFWGQKSSTGLISSLAAGSILKAAFLWGAVTAIILIQPGISPKFVGLMRVMFSYNQLITAAIGSLLAYLIWMQLKKIPRV